MELAGDGDHLRGGPGPGQHLPQQLLVNRVVRLLQVDEARVQGDFSCSSEFVQSPRDEHRLLIVRDESHTIPVNRIVYTNPQLRTSFFINKVVRREMPDCVNNIPGTSKLLLVNRQRKSEK